MAMKLGSRNRDEITPRDVAAYIMDVADQLARLSREMGLDTVAGPLEQAQRAAAKVLHEKAAPEDAA
jgi:hypothetical protein